MNIRMPPDDDPLARSKLVVVAKIFVLTLKNNVHTQLISRYSSSLSSNIFPPRRFCVVTTLVLICSSF
jgi:hypothetical protein